MGDAESGADQKVGIVKVHREPDLPDQTSFDERKGGVDEKNL